MRHVPLRAQGVWLQVGGLVEKGIPYSRQVADAHCPPNTHPARMPLQCICQHQYFAPARGVGHGTELNNVSYSLSEDFVSSYRMHPLLPDLFNFDGDSVSLL